MSAEQKKLQELSDEYQNLQTSEIVHQLLVTTKVLCTCLSFRSLSGCPSKAEARITATRESECSKGRHAGSREPIY
jgi:hypothetical protein